MNSNDVALFDQESTNVSPYQSASVASISFPIAEIRTSQVAVVPLNVKVGVILVARKPIAVAVIPIANATASTQMKAFFFMYFTTFQQPLLLLTLKGGIIGQPTEKMFYFGESFK